MYATKQNVKEGDILTYAFHWAARTPMFVKVIRRTNSSVTFVELGKKTVSHDGYGQNGTCIADTEKISSHERKAMFSRKGENILRINDKTCYIWDGTPEEFWTD